MKVSHVASGTSPETLAANIAQNNADLDAALFNVAKKGLRVLLVASALTATAVSCSHDAGTSTDGISQLIPEIECGTDSSDRGVIDNWANGGVIKSWADGSMTMSYEMQSGDNLGMVANCYFKDPSKGVDAIVHENKIDNPDMIQPKTIVSITIDNPVRIKLADHADSIADLAMQTGFSVDQIYAANGQSFSLNEEDAWRPDGDTTIRLPIQKAVEDEPKSATTTTTLRATTTTTEVKPHPGENPDRREQIDAFRQKWSEYAEAVEKEFGINKNAVLAQAILESQFGSSLLATDGSNLFGAKAHRGALHTPYWKGATIPNETTEFLTDAMLRDPYWQVRLVKRVGKTDDGFNEVRVNADFRKYPNFKSSFGDYGYKITHEKTYADAAALKRDPIAYIAAVGKAGYATDPDYVSKVRDIFNELEALDKAGEPDPPLPPAPKSGSGEIINPKDLDYSNFPDQKRDAKLRQTINLAISNLNLKEFQKFKKSGVLDKSSLAKGVMSQEGEYYKLLGRKRDAQFRFIIWHLWANGITESGLDAVGGTETKSSQGNSHDITLEAQVNSWHNGYISGRFSSAQYLVGDNEEVWQLSDAPFTKALHAGYGVMDEGKKHVPGVSNENSIAIETQADTIYDVTAGEFKELIYLTGDRMILAKLVTSHMSEDEIAAAVHKAVVGHGKNGSKFNGSGVEFGWKYREPLVQAVTSLLIADLKG